MIAASLTSERVKLKDGTTALPFEWEGERVLVRDSARNGVEIARLFMDPAMPVEEKAGRVVFAMFADPEDAYCAADYSTERFGELISAVAWDVFGINAGGHEDEPPVWDIEQDAAMIRASLRQAYGIDWDEERGRISWHEFLTLIGSLPIDTPLGRAMYYRNADNRPEKTKYNAKQVEEFDRLHSLFKLNRTQKGSQDRIETQQHAMDDMALAFKAKLAG